MTNTEPSPDRRRDLLSPQELADFLNVPTATIYGWRHRGVGPRGIRVGRHVCYRLADVERWLNTRPATGGAA